MVLRRGWPSGLASRASAESHVARLGCTPSPRIVSPVRHKIILVSYARCGWAADNWAFMSRDVLEVYVKGIVEQEAGLGHELLKNSIASVSRMLLA